MIAIKEVTLTEDIISELISMSQDWEAEVSTHGYAKNTSEDIEGRRVFLAYDGDKIVGYLFGKSEEREKPSSVIAVGSKCFEVEELYIIPSMRSKGVGRSLFSYAEKVMASEGIEFLTLATATKDYKRILHFYIDELGMEFWNARLFKKL
jgi:GNAT superfamily N-acetyltransferase